MEKHIKLRLLSTISRPQTVNRQQIRKTPAKKSGKRCIHGKANNGYLCIQCPGKGICSHRRVKYTCKICKGGGICIHNKQKSQCNSCKPKAKIGEKIKLKLAPEKDKTKSGEKVELKLSPGNKVKTEEKVKLKLTPKSKLKTGEKVNLIIPKHRQSTKSIDGKCIHGGYNNGYFCKQCPGKGLCVPHLKQKAQCRLCMGSSICKEHKKIKSRCIKCKGSETCEHKHIRRNCKICKGYTLCIIHNRQYYTCTLCKGPGVCVHNKRKNLCLLCDGKSRCVHGRIKSYCAPCGGKSMCVHNRLKRTCKPCGGSGVCPHGNSQKSQCTKCRAARPIEEVLSRHKHACQVCGQNLRSLKRRLEKLCIAHSKDYKKRPEEYWREELINQLDFQPSAIDESVYTNSNCKGERFRPDLLYLLKDLAIILEFDETSHLDYEVDCEIKRAVNLRDAFPDQKLLIIRMNPDVCKSALKELKDMAARTSYMIEVMRPYLENHTELFSELSAEITNVIYLFYGEGGRKHIEMAREHNDKVKIIDTFYCD